jgi:hypothetical protein
MAADFSGQDPKALWRNQAPEADPVPLERVHAMVRRYERRMRLSVGVLALCLVVVGLLSGQLWAKAHDALMRVLTILFVAGELSVCAISYRVAFPPRDPAEPAGAYLRRRLQIRLDNAKGRWMLMASPLAPFILLSVYVTLTTHRGPVWARLLPYGFVVAVLVFVGVRMRTRIPKLKARLDELDEFLGS